MTAFDTTLNVSNITIDTPKDESASYLVVSLEVGQTLPVQGNQAVMIPVGTFRFPMNGDKAIQLGEELKKEGAKLPKPSRLAVASSLEEVDAEAEGLKALKTKENYG